MDQAELRRFVAQNGLRSWSIRYTIPARAAKTLACDGRQLLPSGDTSVVPPAIHSTRTVAAPAPVQTSKTVANRIGPPDPIQQSNFIVPLLAPLVPKVIDTVVDRITRRDPAPTPPVAPLVPQEAPFDPCPGGVRIPNTNRCFQTPFVPQTSGPSTTAVVPVSGVQQGIFGALSADPMVEQTQRLRCPPGLVLGKDNRCYAKGTIPRKFRKWVPAKRPPVSASDAACIRRANAAVNRVKKLAQSTGRLSVKNK
jgi:hypothetical protein